MKPHFRPFRDRVLLKRVEVEEKTPAGIIISGYGKGETGRGRGTGRRPRST